MIVAIQGCCHGELDKIYEAIKADEVTKKRKVDLLLCCGDFQAIRNNQDLNELTCKWRYRKYKDFKDYYNGEKVAPVLTIFVGGNHEAPELLRHLYFGGWVAPNIYYLGHSGVINISGLRIAGISGIYNYHDFKKGFFEHSPYNESTKRSAYHIREYEIAKLSLIREPIDIFLSHDWPRGVWKYGDLNSLLHQCPHFEEDINNGNLGNPETAKILDKLKPRFWFSAHLHVKFEADVNHEDGSTTHFLALDKPLGNRHFLEIMSIPLLLKNVVDSSESRINVDINKELSIYYDREWCAILKANGDRMPLNTFSSNVDIKLREPSQDDFKEVDVCFKNSTLKHNDNDPCYYQVPECTKELYENVQKQRELFMGILGLPDNTFFTPDNNTKLEVILRE
ncbi:bifunctional Metallo-dependent phosphatase-like/Lariat debranching enzyme [Babesia duncani]|uniref:Bifunctional Metallo-dependent phosphatase-like/Lariat debranching enzyme n=1 Tax=Babesia duncani TaxID=323732 RepID=A0AAD9PJJ0_9APIC|nr:bifunctional Metallo-dependent phosphatase-like/Lariat debranching enzyme [Babesia duncani]